MAQEADKHALEYIFKPISQKLTAGETLYADLFIKNNTDKVITICKWCNIHGKNIVSKIEGSNQYSYVDEFVTTSIPEKEDFIELKAFQELLLYDDMDYGPEYFPTNGIWILQLHEEYLGVNEDLDLNSWKGKIESNTIEITVFNSSTKI